MTDFINSFGIILYATLVYMTPLLYASLGSCFSEVFVALISVSDHGIHGVCGFVDYTAQRAEECDIEKWRDDPVAGALRYAFHRCSDHTGPVKVFSVPSYYHGNSSSGIIDIGKSVIYPHAVILKAFYGKALPGD